jgi:hypothetical protein
MFVFQIGRNRITEIKIILVGNTGQHITLLLLCWTKHGTCFTRKSNLAYKLSFEAFDSNFGSLFPN